VLPQFVLTTPHITHDNQLPNGFESAPADRPNTPHSPPSTPWVALELRRLVSELGRPVSVRCIVSASETNAIFRFHQIRPGESWNNPNLDAYLLEKVVVLDIPPGRADEA
jgi:hypothetical protein